MYPYYLKVMHISKIYVVKQVCTHIFLEYIQPYVCMFQNQHVLRYSWYVIHALCMYLYSLRKHMYPHIHFGIIHS
jgi:hypothetical protein